MLFYDVFHVIFSCHSFLLLLFHSLLTQLKCIFTCIYRFFCCRMHHFLLVVCLASALGPVSSELTPCGECRCAESLLYCPGQGLTSLPRAEDADTVITTLALQVRSCVLCFHLPRVLISIGKCFCCIFISLIIFTFNSLFGVVFSLQRNFIEQISIEEMMTRYPGLTSLDVRRQYTGRCVTLAGDVLLMRGVVVRG